MMPCAQPRPRTATPASIARRRRPHHREFPAGYPSAGCSPAEPASASPAVPVYVHPPARHNQHCCPHFFSPSADISCSRNQQTACHSRAPSRQSSRTEHAGRGERVRIAFTLLRSGNDLMSGDDRRHRQRRHPRSDDRERRAALRVVDRLSTLIEWLSDKGSPTPPARPGRWPARAAWRRARHRSKARNPLIVIDNDFFEDSGFSSHCSFSVRERRAIPPSRPAHIGPSRAGGQTDRRSPPEAAWS
jgi:hypothetical protein